MSPAELTAKQQAFADEYIRNGRHGAAAYRVAYDCSTANPITVAVSASRLLDNPKIALYIGEVLEPPTKEWAVSKLRHIVELCLIDEKKDLPTARATLATLAAVQGWISPTRSEKAVLDLSRLKPEQLRVYIRETMAGLPESDRRAIARLEPGVIDADVQVVQTQDATPADSDGQGNP